MTHAEQAKRLLHDCFHDAMGADSTRLDNFVDCIIAAAVEASMKAINLPGWPLAEGPLPCESQPATKANIGRIEHVIATAVEAMREERSECSGDDVIEECPTSLTGRIPGEELRLLRNRIAELEGVIRRADSAMCGASFLIEGRELANLNNAMRLCRKALREEDSSKPSRS